MTDTTPTVLLRFNKGYQNLLQKIDELAAELGLPRNETILELLATRFAERDAFRKELRERLRGWL